MKTPRSKRHGFTLVEIMIVIAIVGLLAALAIPNYLRHREFAQAKVCVKNLSAIDAAKHMWGVENAKVSSDTPADSDLFGESLYIRQKPSCPSGGTYTMNTIGEHASCNVSDHEL
jgi:prepilin-type N-terminal cleavage/methylation domain-containing protein